MGTSMTPSRVGRPECGEVSVGIQFLRSLRSLSASHGVAKGSSPACRVSPARRDRDATTRAVLGQYRNGVNMRRIDRSLVRLGILIVATGSAGAVATAAQAEGTLRLSGGITATFKLNHANCAAGPGDTLTVTAGSGGGWDALSLTAFDPTVGHRGTAGVVLNETGFKKAVSAVADWSWTARKDSGHISRPLSITSDGEAGTFSVTLAVSDYFQAPKTRPVKVTATWGAGTCKA